MEVTLLQLAHSHKTIVILSQVGLPAKRGAEQPSTHIPRVQVQLQWSTGESGIQRVCMERATHTDLVSTRKWVYTIKNTSAICCPTRTMRPDVFEHTVSPAMPFEPGDVIGVFHPWFEDTNVQLQIDPKAFSLFYAYSTYNEDYVTPPYAQFRVSNATASIGALLASVEITPSVSRPATSSRPSVQRPIQTDLPPPKEDDDTQTNTLSSHNQQQPLSSSQIQQEISSENLRTQFTAASKPPRTVLSSPAARPPPRVKGKGRKRGGIAIFIIAALACTLLIVVTCFVVLTVTVLCRRKRTSANSDRTRELRTENRDLRDTEVYCTASSTAESVYDYSVDPGTDSDNHETVEYVDNDAYGMFPAASRAVNTEDHTFETHTYDYIV